jgi:hypothetical protein
MIYSFIKQFKPNEKKAKINQKSKNGQNGFDMDINTIHWVNTAVKPLLQRHHIVKISMWPKIII